MFEDNKVLHNLCGEYNHKDYNNIVEIDNNAENINSIRHHGEVNIKQKTKQYKKECMAYKWK